MALFPDVAAARAMRLDIYDAKKRQQGPLAGLTGPAALDAFVYAKCPICLRTIGVHADGMPCYSRNEWDRFGLHHSTYPG